MFQPINDIVNSKRNYHWNIDNDHRKTVKRRSRHQVDAEAHAIELKMGNVGDQVAHKLYCKVLYKLAPVTIWNCVELALNKGRKLKFKKYRVEVIVSKNQSAKSEEWYSFEHCILQLQNLAITLYQNS